MLNLQPLGCIRHLIILATLMLHVFNFETFSLEDEDNSRNKCSVFTCINPLYTQTQLLK